MDKVLEGELASFHVPDLLTFLHMAARTGVLTLEQPAAETKLFFREGRPVFATSSKEELRLGKMLVRHGKVTEDALERALQSHRTAGHRLGQALLAERLLSQAELALFLKVQVSEVIFQTFEWTGGLFTFWDAIPAPATAVTLEMDIQNLIMEGVRRIDERERINDVFPNLDMCVATVANPEWVKHSVTMTPEEWKVFFLADGRRSLSEICRLAGNPDELATLQVLHNLVQAKLLVVVPPQPEPAPGEAPPVMPPPLEPHGTQKLLDGKPAPAAGPVSVEFSSGLRPPKKDDDTKEVVTPAAVHYEAPRQVTASRLILLKDGNETSFPLVRDAYSLGRHRNNDIVITDPKVSSFHARIDKTADGFNVVDLKSRNGTYVNGQRIETAALRTGDEVRLGTAKLQYRVDYTSN